MQDYRNFEPEELATDPSFQRWKLFNDPQESDFWQKWMVQNPDKKELVDKAAFLLITLNEAYARIPNDRVPVSDREVQHEIHRLRQSLDGDEQPVAKWYQFTPLRYGMAASVLVLLGLFWRLFIHQPCTKVDVTYNELITQASQPLQEVANPDRKTRLVTLPDGSTLLLKTGGRVSYPKNFPGAIREVYLVGEAFFEVHKDPNKPFYVYAKGLVTKVLGTSFTIQAFENDKQVKVVVKTGKVSVFARNNTELTQQKENNKLEGVVLTPNQQIVFSPTNTQIIKSLVEKPALLDSQAQSQPFRFKRTPIAEVFATLEKSYGIKIVFDEEVMKSCYLTASLDDEPLFEKLDLICNTINARYEQLDAHIIINSRGCQP
ncbi:FecR family protein [Larkinella sp. VNQ87]|uniref:FecR family protein n=1 Tax=Larkinella sp. VNQ87 TaxID=3400921 RepID=UPI003BFE55DD